MRRHPGKGDFRILTRGWYWLSAKAISLTDWGVRRKFHLDLARQLRTVKTTGVHVFFCAPIGSSPLSHPVDPQDRQNCRHGALGRTT
jgi:hypothetical protein